MNDATAPQAKRATLQSRIWTVPRRGWWRSWLALVVLAIVGCDGLLESDEVPDGVADPGFADTPTGAVAAYQGAISLFRAAFGGPKDTKTGETFVGVTGLFTDELQPFDLGAPSTVVPEDRREGASNIAYATYGLLQRTRAQAGQGIALLARNVPEAPALAGRLYALQGYTEVFLAELFCSGIPLSTLDFGGDYTLAPGSRTEQVFEHAVALFDTALTLAADNVEFLNLARVGRSRALLALGRYAEAAATVAEVPSGYRYLSMSAGFAVLPIEDNGSWIASMSDREGLNGLDYRSSDDPRTGDSLVREDNGFGRPIYYPTKYSPRGDSAVVVASGVEARLIEAEAALHANPEGGTWLATLNALRADGTQNGSGVYNSGTGGIAGLAPLTDPGTERGRQDLVFRERAFWLYLTGHRQGDLRRLVRAVARGGYGRAQGEVYPTGPYPAPLAPLYGSDVTIPIPPSEEETNPLYTGCINRDA